MYFNTPQCMYGDSNLRVIKIFQYVPFQPFQFYFNVLHIIYKVYDVFEIYFIRFFMSNIESCFRSICSRIFSSRKFFVSTFAKVCSFEPNRYSIIYLKFSNEIRSVYLYSVYFYTNLCIFRIGRFHQ